MLSFAIRVKRYKPQDALRRAVLAAAAKDFAVLNPVGRWGVLITLWLGSRSVCVELLV